MLVASGGSCLLGHPGAHFFLRRKLRLPYAFFDRLIRTAENVPWSVYHAKMSIWKHFLFIYFIVYFELMFLYFGFILVLFARFYSVWIVCKIVLFSYFLIKTALKRKFYAARWVSLGESRCCWMRFCLSWFPIPPRIHGF